MSARQDFHLSIERAAGLTMDATCAARGAGYAPLPQPHRRLLASAVRKLEGAQDDLFKLRTSPWDQPKPRRGDQLELAA